MADPQQTELPLVTAPGVMGGAYDAANRNERTLAAWSPAVRSVDGDVLPDKTVADARAHDTLRNDAFALSGAQMHRDSIVGKMFLLNAKPNIRVLGLDDEWEKEFQEEVEAHFEVWAESYNCWVDASRRNTFTGLVRLAVGGFVATGELLATAEWVREGRRPYRTAVQMIDPSRLSNPADQTYNMDRTRGGVRLSAAGEPLGYWIRRALPGPGIDTAFDQQRWSYIRAHNAIGRPQVLHVIEQQRPGQTRGMSQLVAALKEMRMLKQFRDITIQNAVVNASYAAAVTSELPPQVVFEQLGGGAVGNAIVDYAQSYLSAVAGYGENARNMSIDGAKIPHLFPGTKLDLTPMGTPGGMGSDFEKAMLRYVAADLGVSFEQLSKDYTETNYSSARAGMLETWKMMQGRKKLVADRFGWTVFRLWFEEAVNAGVLSTMSARSVPNIYDGLNMEAFTHCEFVGAGHGQIDEYKETQAAALRIEAKLSTHEQEIARMGGDWRTVLKQQSREQEYMKELGIDPVSLATEMAEATAPDPAEDERNERERDE